MYAFRECDRLHDENCKRIREFVKQYVKDRKDGKNQSSFKEKIDFLSLFLSHEEEFNDLEGIVDELIEFFIAASATTSTAVQTVIYHLIKDPVCVSNLREEYDKLKEGRENEELSKVMHDVTTIDNISPLTYLGAVVYESLRFMAPLPNVAE